MCPLVQIYFIFHGNLGPLHCSVPQRSPLMSISSSIKFWNVLNLDILICSLPRYHPKARFWFKPTMFPSKMTNQEVTYSNSRYFWVFFRASEFSQAWGCSCTQRSQPPRWMLFSYALYSPDLENCPCITSNGQFGVGGQKKWGLEICFTMEGLRLKKWVISFAFHCVLFLLF